MEINIELSYKGKTRNAALIGTHISNVVLLKMVTSVIAVLQEHLITESGGTPEEAVAGMNCNISWQKI